MDEKEVKEENLSYKIRLRIYKDDLAFGPGVAQLLELVEELGTLSAACRAMGMAYSKGWRIIKRAEESFGFPLVNGTSGGASGGRMYLTEEGKKLLCRYREMENELNRTAEGLFRKYFLSK